MLVLTRRVGEEIVIDGHIRIKVLISKGDRVRLGIIAPASVRVDRQEVHERRDEFDTAAVIDRIARSAGNHGAMQRRLVAASSAFTGSFEDAAPVHEPVP